MDATPGWAELNSTETRRPGQVAAHRGVRTETLRRPCRSPATARRHTRGTTLVEVLVAFLALSFGVVALARIHGQLRLGAETARQRAEAVRLAEDDMEQLRAFSSIAASGAARSFADVIPATRTIDASTGSPGSTRFALERQVDAAGVPSAREVTVFVRWQDGAGAAQRVVLASLIAANDPALGGALAAAPAGPASAAASLP